jgi:signal transduction histidine kinase
MLQNENYKKAYERQKQARQQAESLLESRSKELYTLNEDLIKAYNKLKDQKAQLVHNEKLASIGQLAAGIAHEVNNPAAYVKSNVNTLKNYVQSVATAFKHYEEIIHLCVDEKHCDTSLIEKSKKIREDLDIEFVLDDLEDTISDTMEGLERIEDIVKSLKDFSRPDQAEPVRYNINDCINNTIKVAWNQVKYKAELNKSFSNLPDIYGQPGSMGQVFLNLIVNAAQAIESFGTISITTATSNNQIIIKIADDGCGIAKENLNKIFDPFFTTKEIGKGTGLGLSISSAIIKKQGGTIDVASTSNGTTFTINLPITRADES